MVVNSLFAEYFASLVNFIYCYKLTMQDVAVKVLTVQDFHDDQLREFLREVL